MIENKKNSGSWTKC